MKHSLGNRARTAEFFDLVLKSNEAPEKEVKDKSVAKEIEKVGKRAGALQKELIETKD